MIEMPTEEPTLRVRFSKLEPSVRKRGGSGCNDQERGEQPPCDHQAPVKILSTSCFTVGMKPFE